MSLVQRHASWGSTNSRVTIVEGNIALAVALSHNLKTEGYVVESLDRGDEAVRRLADAPPDLVILDWMSSGGIDTETLAGFGLAAGCIFASPAASATSRICSASAGWMSPMKRSGVGC